MKKSKLAKLKHADLREKGEQALNIIRNKRQVLRAAIEEGICGLAPDDSLDEAEERLKQAARDGDPAIHYDEFTPEGCACFYAYGGITCIFPLS